MAADPSQSLVSTEWLAAHLEAPDVRVVDASYYLPHEGLDPRTEFEAHHIPGAVFFDIDEIADSSVDLQPCGGTHVARTGEIGQVEVRKIENKGRQNRRINIVFAA